MQWQLKNIGSYLFIFHCYKTQLTLATEFWTYHPTDLMLKMQILSSWKIIKTAQFQNLVFIYSLQMMFPLTDWSSGLTRQLLAKMLNSKTNQNFISLHLQWPNQVTKHLAEKKKTPQFWFVFFFPPNYSPKHPSARSCMTWRTVERRVLIIFILASSSIHIQDFRNYSKETGSLRQLWSFSHTTQWSFG